MNLRQYRCHKKYFKQNISIILWFHHIPESLIKPAKVLKCNIFYGNNYSEKIINYLCIKVNIN